MIYEIYELEDKTEDWDTWWTLGFGHRSTEWINVALHWSTKINTFKCQILALINNLCIIYFGRRSSLPTFTDSKRANPHWFTHNFQKYMLS